MKPSFKQIVEIVAFSLFAAFAFVVVGAVIQSDDVVSYAGKWIMSWAYALIGVLNLAALVCVGKEIGEEEK